MADNTTEYKSSVPRLGFFGTNHNQPTQIQQDVARQNNDLRYQTILPDQLAPLDYVLGPFTYHLCDLGVRMNADGPNGTSGTACDGSALMYASSAASRRRYEYMTSSPQGLLVDMLLSMWTTRTWTHTIQAGMEFLIGACNYLKLDWLGGAPGDGSHVPGKATHRSRLKFFAHKDPVTHDSGD